MNHFFSLSNTIDGAILMITQVFGCDAKVSLVQINHEGEISDKLIKEVNSKGDISNDISKDIVIKSEDLVANIFRIDITYEGRNSEIYLDLFDRPHKSNGTCATFTIQGSCKSQTPIAYLISSISLDQPLLTFKQIADLFHELGHALHIALSKTQFQLT
jgi:Zn-dependent oligopeptidase